MTTLHCPDCGSECQHVSTNGLENQFCFTCVNHKNPLHWERYAGSVVYVRESECLSCHPPEDEAPKCYSRAPDGWKCGHKIKHTGDHDALRRKVTA